jgi:hypothetical protein
VPAAADASSASGRSGALELSIAVAGTSLRVALTNAGAIPLPVYFAARGPDGAHHDNLSAELASAGRRRTLRFTGARNASTTGLVELAAGETAADTLDLTAWARAEINGAEPLAPGSYTLTATYRVAQPGAWQGAIEAGPVALLVPRASASCRISYDGIVGKSTSSPQADGPTG